MDPTITIEIVDAYYLHPENGLVFKLSRAHSFVVHKLAFKIALRT